MRRSLLAVLGVASTLFSVAPAALAQEQPSRYPAETRRLANGLRVVVSPQHDTARVAVLVRYGVGLRDDPDGYHGLAHMTEHMMFQRTRHVGEDELPRLLEAAGATNINAETARDATDYFEVLPAEQLPLALWLESERMAFLLDGVTDAGVASQRRVVIDEDTLRTARTGGIASVALAHALYPVTHLYRNAVDDADDLSVLGAHEVGWFFEQYYAPHNATVIIAGDVDPAETFARVEHDFGGLRDRTGSPRPALGTERTAMPQRTVTLEAPVSRERVRLTWRTPPDFAPGNAELDILASMLAGDDEAPLRAVLVTSGTAESVEARQHSDDLGSEFAIEIELAEGHTAQEAIARAVQQVDALRHGTIDTNDFEEWRSLYVRAVHAAEDDVLARARALARYASRLDQADGFAFDANRYAAVTVESLRHAARRLRPEACITEIVLQNAHAPRPGRVVSSRARRRAL